MKTVTICGSMRFEKDMLRIAFLLETKHKLNVLQCIYNMDNQDISQNELKNLEEAHYKKIELADAIYVVDLDGYIGESVNNEIAYAKELGKEIIYNSVFIK